MEQHGFIRDMLDVKMLILYVMAKVMYPLTLQEIYELSYQDDCLSYFDLSIAVPQMVQTGHLTLVDEERYAITDKGRDAQKVTEDGIPYSVLQRARVAVERFNRGVHRNSMIRTEYLPRENGEYGVVLGLDDATGNLMTIELMAPNRQQAKVLGKAFQEKADRIYQLVMEQLLEKPNREGEEDQV